MKIYKINRNGYFGGELNIPDRKGIPLYTTRTIPPEAPDGMFIKWSGKEWVLTAIDPESLIKIPVETILIDSDTIIDSIGLIDSVQMIDSNL